MTQGKGTVKVIHIVGARPFAERAGSVFRETVLPDGTIVRQLDRAVFQNACAAAGKVIHQSLERLKLSCPS